MLHYSPKSNTAITKSIVSLLLATLLFSLFCCRRFESDHPSSGSIPNSSFESADENKPAHWQQYTWRGEASFTHAAFGHSGERSAGISSDTGADASWGIIVPVRPFSEYRLTAWIKTENLTVSTGRGALINLHGIEGGETEALSGTCDWTAVSMEFSSERNDAVQINCLYGGWGYVTGSAWFDDVGLELLSSRELSPRIVIHAEQEKKPISKYLYGQFIEHLGRCIYGGLWAEMLEDRKFYYPITDAYAPWGSEAEPHGKTGIFKPVIASPWKVLGSPGSVAMDEVDPYVGSHTPVVTLPGEGEVAGIGQENLALIKHKTYEGHIVLCGHVSGGTVDLRMVIDNVAIPFQAISLNSGTYETYRFSFASPSSSDNARLEITSNGRGNFKIGTVSLMPADNIKGFRRDTIELLRELNSPIYRWPGGNFVSGYNWRDGIGPRDRRPPRKNPAWTGLEHNDVGIHEYMDLMSLIGAEPFIAVNTGVGSVAEVAEEVAYCNAPASTPLGALRSENGSPQPFNVHYWAVGNEMYGSWQLGHMPLENYVKKHIRVAEAMWSVDPSIELVAVGSVGKWSETMLAECADHMNLISEHIYAQERPGLLGHCAWLAEMIRWKADAHRGYRRDIPALAEKDIRIAMDEWNYWYGPYIFGELGVRYFLKDALGVAVGLHEYFRNSDLYFMANYAQTVNVIGCIKTTPTEAAFETTGLVLKLYREKFGSTPVQIEGSPEPLDVAAAWSEDRRTFTIAIVNPTRQRFALPLQMTGATVKGAGSQWLIAGRDDMEYNEPGAKPGVTIKEKNFKKIAHPLPVAPLSISLFRIEVE